MISTQPLIPFSPYFPLPRAWSDEAATFTILFLFMANHILLLTPLLGSHICTVCISLSILCEYYFFFKVWNLTWGGGLRHTGVNSCLLHPMLKVDFPVCMMLPPALAILESTLLAHTHRQCQINKRWHQQTILVWYRWGLWPLDQLFTWPEIYSC
jgi:hypothetical protein